MTDKATFIEGDCLQVMGEMAPASVDLVFGSPPYEDCRTYGIDFDLQGQVWVDWMVEVFRASLRVSRGLVAMVLEGKTRQYRWTATPAMLMADLHRAGIHLRKPPLFHRVGIPGSGGPDWLRNDYEFIVCATNGGKLPWSDNTASGHAPKYPSGGKYRARKPNGNREWRDFSQPARCNPGNVIRCLVGGRRDSTLAFENEAPFPERLAEFFITSFCPPDGVVLDPFSGSGTTVATAIKCGRRGIGVDVRASQVALGRRRIDTEAPLLAR